VIDDIDWTDLCDIGAELLAAELEPRHQDLRGQGLTLLELHTMQDVETTGDWL
jgi:hypothetical protein